MLDLTAIDVAELKTIFAYPYGRLVSVDQPGVTVLTGRAPAELRNAWRLGLTYEMLGAMRAALQLTVDHVKQRQQFKRPIGSFQAVQHRLSENVVHIESVSLLAARAAWSGETADIALAAAHAQKTAAQLIYDCHQFHGAMGLTLEYVLHHWTYRLKVLAGELGGASAQARAAAATIWRTAA
jgi:alkylation response protein AidB-like acyl-CoA dehydrogenase